MLIKKNLLRRACLTFLGIASLAVLTGCGNHIRHYHYHAEPQSAVERTDLTNELPNTVFQGGSNLLGRHGFDLLAFGSSNYRQNLEAFHNGSIEIQRNLAKRRGKYRNPANYTNNVGFGDNRKVYTTFHKHTLTLTRNVETNGPIDTLKFVKYRLHSVKDVSSNHDNRTQKIKKQFVFYPYEIKRRTTSAHHISEHRAKHYALTLTRVSAFSHHITNGNLPYE